MILNDDDLITFVTIQKKYPQQSQLYKNKDNMIFS